MWFSSIVDSKCSERPVSLRWDSTRSRCYQVALVTPLRAPPPACHRVPESFKHPSWLCDPHSLCTPVLTGVLPIPLAHSSYRWEQPWFFGIKNQNFPEISDGPTPGISNFTQLDICSISSHGSLSIVISRLRSDLGTGFVPQKLAPPFPSPIVLKSSTLRCWQQGERDWLSGLIYLP